MVRSLRLAGAINTGLRGGVDAQGHKGHDDVARCFLGFNTLHFGGTAADFGGINFLGLADAVYPEGLGFVVGRCILCVSTDIKTLKGAAGEAKHNRGNGEFFHSQILQWLMGCVG